MSFSLSDTPKSMSAGASPQTQLGELTAIVSAIGVRVQLFFLAHFFRNPPYFYFRCA